MSVGQNSPWTTVALKNSAWTIVATPLFSLSQPQLNHKLTQKLGLTRKGLYTTATTHIKLNVINISAFPDPILAKL